MLPRLDQEWESAIMRPLRGSLSERTHCREFGGAILPANSAVYEHFTQLAEVGTANPRLVRPAASTGHSRHSSRLSRVVFRRARRRTHACQLRRAMARQNAPPKDTNMLARLSIRAKLLAVVSLLLVSLAAMGGFGLVQLRSQNAHLVDIQTSWLPSVQSAGRPARQPRSPIGSWSATWSHSPIRRRARGPKRPSKPSPRTSTRCARPTSR